MIKGTGVGWWHSFKQYFAASEKSFPSVFAQSGHGSGGKPSFSSISNEGKYLISDVWRTSPKPFLLLLCFAGTFKGIAQTSRIDSLLSLIRITHNNENKLALILAVAEDHHSLNKDTLYHYASIARELALSTNTAYDDALADLALASSYLKWGWTDSALASIEPHVKKYSPDDPSTRDMYFRIGRQRALCYGIRADYKNALDLLYQLVNNAEKYNDSIAIGANMNTIGSVAIARGLPAEASGWFARALKYSGNSRKFYHNRAAIYVNLANAYFDLGKLDSASIYINLSLPLARAVGNLHTLATALRIKSNISLQMKNNAGAEQALTEMISVREKTKDSDLLVEESLLLIDFYINTDQYDKAIDHCKLRLRTGNVYQESEQEGVVFTNNIQLRLPYYEALARAYKAAGRTEQYQQTLEEIIGVKDSVYEASSAGAIAEIQTKYEVQKKENTIIQQEMDIARKNYMFYGSLVFATLIAIIGWLLFKDYTRKQKRKLERMKEEEKHLSLAAIKQAEEKERRRIAEDLHDNLGAYAASISSNLEYLFVPETDRTSRIAVEELKLNAKSIVSQLNDTIWALNKETLSLTSISDRIKLFLQRMAPSYPRVKLEVRERIMNDELLLPFQAFHLFQIVQEAVTNSLKHSQSDNISVHIESDASWFVNIMDNGKGMNGQLADTGGGNGLVNMKSRARKSGWSIMWQKNLPQGTQVIITPTIN